MGSIDTLLGQRDDFQVLAFSKDTEDYLPMLLSKLDQAQVSFPVLYFGNDSDINRSLNRFAPFIPENYLINPQGVLLSRVSVGIETAELLEQIMEMKEPLKPITILLISFSHDSGDVEISMRIQHDYDMALPLHITAGYNIRVYVPELDKDNTGEPNADTYERIDEADLPSYEVDSGTSEFSFKIPHNEAAHMVQYTVSVPFPGTEGFTEEDSFMASAYGLKWVN